MHVVDQLGFHILMLVDDIVLELFRLHGVHGSQVKNIDVVFLKFGVDLFVGF